MEDVVQVGTIGLIKAIDRFDLSREVEFTTFAVPYIVGEIKRFFRDTSWAVHVPRRLQELRIDLAKANEELFQRLDRSPTDAELAEHLGLSEDEVIDGLVASNGYTASLARRARRREPGRPGRPRTRTGSATSIPPWRSSENLHALKPLMEQLGDRDRRILQMRFGEEMTQSEIGAELGVSQMHVSRLLTKALTRLRRGMLAGRPNGPTATATTSRGGLRRRTSGARPGIRSGPTLPCGVLPAVPASSAAARRGTDDEAEQPDRENDHGDPPQCLQGEPGTEEKEREKQYHEKGNHDYQPPPPEYPSVWGTLLIISVVVERRHEAQPGGAA